MLIRNNKMRIVFILLLVCVLPGLASAADTWLYSMSGMRSPHNTAVAPSGDIIVTESIWNTVNVYDHNGNFKKKVSMEYPGPVAVDANGLIYMAWGKFSKIAPPYDVAGEVKVFDGNFGYLRSLGSGAGEFINPNDIAIGADGKIYVSDSEANHVKVFNADGSLALTFGQYGTGDGFFNDPLAVTIDDATGEIYVADKQLTTNSSGGAVAGARIQVYDQTGAFIRGFGDFSATVGAGNLISPTDMVLYNGKLYVSDAYQNVVQVFDASTGQNLNILQYSNSLRLPTSLAVSPDGIIYVVSSNTHQVFVYGTDNFVAFNATPKSLSFTAHEGGQAPANQDVTISNTGAGSLDWTASTDESWITVGTASGTIASGLSDTDAIGIDQSGLQAGSYTGEVSIADANSVTETVTVSLTVQEPPVLSADPAALVFSGESGGVNPPSQNVQVTLANAIAGTIWTASSDAAWLSINPVQAGGGTTAAIVSVDTTGLSAGDYTGQITLESAGATGSPAGISVTLSLSSSGTINVTTNNASASFTITGPAAAVYTGSGLSWSQSPVEDGAYTIQYDAIPGYRTPSSETLNVVDGGTITFIGNYTDLRQEVNILASHGPGNKDNSDITVFRADGTSALTITPFTYNYGASTAVGDVNGDGNPDIIAGVGPGSKVPAEVRGFNSDGSPIAGLDFLAHDTKFGVVVATGDFDGDGKEEIITGQGKTSSEVRVFSYSGGSVIDTGVYTVAYPGIDLGVRVSAADLDGDAVPELIASPEETSVIPMVTIYKVDTSQGMGSWSAQLHATIQVCDSAVGTNLTTGDIDADGISEIIVVCPLASGTEVRMFTIQGTLVASFPTGSARKDYVAAGDTDMDGVAEIIVGDGPANKRKTVSVFDVQGTLLQSFDAFGNSFGVRVSTGNLGY